MAGASLTQSVWLERVPNLLAQCVEEWGLRLGEPYEPGAAGYAVRAALPDGRAAVLKLIYPDRESEHEADALALWDGDGAVQVPRRFTSIIWFHSSMHMASIVDSGITQHRRC